ncbi:MAG: ubiquinone biosynthesis protein COQ7 [Clostridia bacterium]|nr:ubiquinone biosynthesis protein COQ7 [Clostridia bacterium]
MFNFLNNSYNNNTYSENANVVDFDTLQKARQDLAGEIQAVIEYDAHIHSTNDRLAKETWKNIKNEELTHVGELLALLNYLDPNQKQFVQKGIAEFMERLK